jgi:hypothetical protein
MRFLEYSFPDYLIAEKGAQESIPIRILLHQSSSHDVPEEPRVEARRQGAIVGGGEAMRA